MNPKTKLGVAIAAGAAAIVLLFAVVAIPGPVTGPPDPMQAKDTLQASWVERADAICDGQVRNGRSRKLTHWLDDLLVVDEQIRALPFDGTFHRQPDEMLQSLERLIADLSLIVSSGSETKEFGPTMTNLVLLASEASDGASVLGAFRCAELLQPASG